MTPILILLFNFDAKVAVGTDILHGAIFKSFGAVRHRMLGTVHARLALWMLRRLGAAVARRRPGRASHRHGPVQRVVGVALIVGGLGFLIKTFIHGHSSDAPFILAARRQGRRDRARRGRRLRRRPHLGRLRHVLRPRDAVPLPADRLQDRRHRHVPRGDAALGHRHGVPDPRRREHARDGVAARRLDPGRADRLADRRQGAGARPAHRVRLRADPLRDQGLRRPAGDLRDRRRARARRARADGLGHPAAASSAGSPRRTRHRIAGLGPAPLDRVPRGAAGGDGRRVRAHREAQAAEEPGLRHEGPSEDLLAGVQLRHLGGHDRLQAAQARQPHRVDGARRQAAADARRGPLVPAPAR